MKPSKKTNKGRKYKGRLSFYPLKLEDVLRAFMQVKPSLKGVRR
jgi:hypothetical protein